MVCKLDMVFVNAERRIVLSKYMLCASGYEGENAPGYKNSDMIKWLVWR